MKWHLKSWEELSKEELYKLLALRIRIFVVEQNCPYQDIDGRDQLCRQLYLEDDEGNILAECRLVPAGLSFSAVSIGRVITNPEARNSGYASQMLQKAIEIFKNEGEMAVEIEAQYYLKDWYAQFGFVENSEPFLEDDIKHVNMLLSL